MKKILLILSIFAITNFAYAQKDSNSVKDGASPATSPASSLTTSSATTSTAVSQSKEVQDQIKEQLIKNEGLGTMAIDHLKSDPEARASLTEIYSKNKGSVSSIMKSVMSDPKLSSKVMDWVNNNPKVLNKAMNLIGM